MPANELAWGRRRRSKSNHSTPTDSLKSPRPSKNRNEKRITHYYTTVDDVSANYAGTASAMKDLIARIRIPVSTGFLRKVKVGDWRRMEQVDAGDGFSVLDGAALVMGSAIASIHILGVRRWDVSVTGWIMVAITFGWVGLTAAGPFIYVARRFARRLPHYPGHRRPPLGGTWYTLAGDGLGTIGRAHQ